MTVEIVFKNLTIVSLPLVPLKLGYHAERLLPMLRRLQVGPNDKVWRGDLVQLSKELSHFNLWVSPHGLRLGLRELMDCGAIGLKPDPRLEPLI